MTPVRYGSTLTGRRAPPRGGAWLLAGWLLVLGASWTSCSNNNGAGAADAGDEEANQGFPDVTIDMGEACNNPCGPVCPCMPGDTFDNVVKCEIIECGPNGYWGGVDCVNGLGCMDAGDEDGDDFEPDTSLPGNPDASGDSSAGDASGDVSAGDVVVEGATGADGAGGPTDSGGQ